MMILCDFHTPLEAASDARQDCMPSSEGVLARPGRSHVGVELVVVGMADETRGEEWLGCRVLESDVAVGYWERFVAARGPLLGNAASAPDADAAAPTAAHVPVHLALVVLHLVPASAG